MQAVFLLERLDGFHRLGTVIPRGLGKIAERFQLALEVVDIRARSAFQQRIFLGLVREYEQQRLCARDTVLLELVLALESASRRPWWQGRNAAWVHPDRDPEIHQAGLQLRDTLAVLHALIQRRVRRGVGNGSGRRRRREDGQLQHCVAVRTKLPLRSMMASCCGVIVCSLLPGRITNSASPATSTTPPPSTMARPAGRSAANAFLSLIKNRAVLCAVRNMMYRNRFFAPTPAYIHASSCGILGERAAHIAAQLSIHPLYTILFFDIRQCIASLFMPYSYIIQTFYVAQMDCVHFREAAAAGFFRANVLRPFARRRMNGRCPFMRTILTRRHARKPAASVAYRLAQGVICDAHVVTNDLFYVIRANVPVRKRRKNMRNEE
jgi:hypothetical protein